MEGGDTGYIRHRKGNLLCSRRESLEFTYLVKVADKYEEALASD